jgi:two-component system, chemotaxis family, chemotaxis protein CheY
VAHVVLIVDDDQDVRDALSEMLEIEGYQVHTARDGVDALDKLNANPEIDLVILDLMMPRMNGLELIERVEKDARISKIPVLVVTASSGYVKKSPARRVLTKPVDVELLLAEVRALVGPQG